MKDPGDRVQADTRRLAAIMFTDMVGFSRQMGSNEARTLRLLEAHNQVIQQTVAEHHGHIIKTIGDAFLVDFPSVVNAVQCAQQVQGQFRAHNAETEQAEQIHVRIGIHLGDIVQRDGDVFGDGVNIASHLQTLAEPDTICISQKVYEEVEKKLPLGAVISLGRPKLKNIAPCFSIYALLPKHPKGLRQTLQVQWLKLSRRVGTAHRVAAAVLLLALVSAGTLVIKNRYFSSAPGLPLPDKPSIVVLSFANLSEDPQQEYFSDGITEDLTTDLSKLSSLFVIARNSAFTYKGKAVKVQDVSREVGVRYVLEGSVRKMDGQVRITAQLVDAATGQHLWAERYDRPLTDIFTLQDEIRQKIVTALKVKLTKEEQDRFKRAPTDNLEAYDYYLRGGSYFLRTTKEANLQAQQMFEKAIELDPQYAGAYAFLSYSYYTDWLYQWTQNPRLLEWAFEAAQKAVTSDDSLSFAHTMLSQVYLGKKLHEQAIAEGERAIALDPNCAACYSNLAGALIWAGQPEKSIGFTEKAIRLDPQMAPSYLLRLSFAYWTLGRHEEAIAAVKRHLTRFPRNPGAYIQLAIAYSTLGREEEARAAAAELLRLSPNFSLEVWRQRAPFKDPGQIERALAALRKAGLN